MKSFFSFHIVEKVKGLKGRDNQYIHKVHYVTLSDDNTFVPATCIYIGYLILYKCLTLLPGWFTKWRTNIVMEFVLLCSYISALITLGKTYGMIFYWLSNRFHLTLHEYFISCTFVFFFVYSLWFFHDPIYRKRSSWVKLIFTLVYYP